MTAGSAVCGVFWRLADRASTMGRGLRQRAAREFAWQTKRLKQIIGLMPCHWVARFMLSRWLPVATAKLKATSTICYLRPWSTDLDCLEKVFLNEEYRLPFDFEFDPRIIVDAGANIGAASMYFAAKFPKARIFALEPEESNFTLLCKNCASFPQIIPIHAALWKNTEPLEISDFSIEKWGFTVRPSKKERPGFVSVTMDGLMGAHGLDRIDLLKLDIEGAEKDIFESEPRDWLQHVLVIAIELHDRFRPGCADAFYSALAGRQFIQKTCGENIFISLKPNTA